METDLQPREKQGKRTEEEVFETWYRESRTEDRKDGGSLGERNGDDRGESSQKERDRRAESKVEGVIQPASLEGIQEAVKSIVKEMLFDREANLKRRQEEKEEMFLMLKKLSANVNTKIDNIEKRVKELEKVRETEKIDKDLQNEINREHLKGELDRERSRTAEGVNGVRGEMEALRKEVNAKLELREVHKETNNPQEMIELRTKVEMEERHRRRNNIVITGLKSYVSRKEDIAKWILERLKVRVTIRSWWMIRNSQGKIGVELENFDMKKEVMRNKHILKNSDIFIDQDLTWEERRTQRMIRAKAERARGEGAKVKVGYMKITEDGETFRWDQRRQTFFREGGKGAQDCKSHTANGYRKGDVEIGRGAEARPWQEKGDQTQTGSWRNGRNGDPVVEHSRFEGEGRQDMEVDSWERHYMSLGDVDRGGEPGMVREKTPGFQRMGRASHQGQ